MTANRTSTVEGQDDTPENSEDELILKKKRAFVKFC